MCLNDNAPHSALRPRTKVVKVHKSQLITLTPREKKMSCKHQSNKSQVEKTTALKCHR